MSTQTELEIVSPGAFASLQDGGRHGFRRIGVPWAGVLDGRLMRIANALAGRDEAAPVIECFDGGLQLTAHGGAAKVAVAGDAVVEVDGPDGRRQLAPWRSVTIAEGESLRIRKMGSGRIAMVAVTGLNAPQVMGSTSTYVRAGLGGADGNGRALAAGTRLALTDADAWGSDHVLTQPPAADERPIRLVPGPQADHFSAAALEALSAATTVSPPKPTAWESASKAPGWNTPPPPRSCRMPPCPARSRSPAPASRSCCSPTPRPPAAIPRSPP